MLALLQIRSRCCGTLAVQQSKCLALLSITWALGSKNAPRGFHQVLQKLWGSPEERFQQSFREGQRAVARVALQHSHGVVQGDRVGSSDRAREADDRARSAHLIRGGMIRLGPEDPSRAKGKYFPRERRSPD